jgi:hypothetical protein
MKLTECLAEGRAVGASPRALLLGGSFIDASNPSPRDVDGVLFYASSGSEATAKHLLALGQRVKEEGIDLRFVPCDANTAIVVRTASFFTCLYTSVRSGAKKARGVVLVDRFDEVMA